MLLVASRLSGRVMASASYARPARPFQKNRRAGVVQTFQANQKLVLREAADGRGLSVSSPGRIDPVLLTIACTDGSDPVRHRHPSRPIALPETARGRSSTSPIRAELDDTRGWLCCIAISPTAAVTTGSQPTRDCPISPRDLLDPDEQPARYLGDEIAAVTAGRHQEFLQEGDDLVRFIHGSRNG